MPADAPAPDTAAAEIARAVEIANALIGRPWRAGESGPEAFDCYGLVLHVDRLLFGGTLPDVGRPAAPLSMREARGHFAASTSVAGWREIERPVHGAVVLMARSGQPSHAGIFLAVGPGHVLHADQDYGVMFESIPGLRARGWGRLYWYGRAR